MKIYLKIKIKSLAAEAAIIRKEERRAVGSLRASLHDHRVVQVRRAARASLLAYGFLRGRALRRMEAKSYDPIPWKEIEANVKRFAEGDPREIMQQFAAWKAEAEAA